MWIIEETSIHVQLKKTERVLKKNLVYGIGGLALILLS